MTELRERLTHSFNFACTMVDVNILELLTVINRYNVQYISDALS